MTVRARDDLATRLALQLLQELLQQLLVPICSGDCVLKNDLKSCWHTLVT